MASTGLGTGSASVTSMNFVGFEELKGQGAPELLSNQIFIEPNLPEASGSGNIAAAGYVPGMQSYLKQRRSSAVTTLAEHGLYNTSPSRRTDFQ